MTLDNGIPKLSVKPDRKDNGMIALLFMSAILSIITFTDESDLQVGWFFFMVLAWGVTTAYYIVNYDTKPNDTTDKRLKN